MSQPAADDRAQAIAVEAIACAAAFAADLDDAGLLEHLEMARRGGPAVLEARRQVPRRELTAEVTEKRNDMPSRPVREREEHLVEVLERDRVAIGHAGQLAQELIFSKQGNLAGRKCARAAGPHCRVLAEPGREAASHAAVPGSTGRARWSSGRG